MCVSRTYQLLMPKCNQTCTKVLRTFSYVQYTYFSLISLFSASQIITSGYTKGDGPIFLDQLNCSGSEQSLLQCPPVHKIGLHHCNHSMDVGLSCSGRVCTNTRVKVFSCVKDLRSGGACYYCCMLSSSAFASCCTLMLKDVVMTVPKTGETSSLQKKQVENACFTLCSLPVPPFYCSWSHETTCG